MTMLSSCYRTLSQFNRSKTFQAQLFFKLPVAQQNISKVSRSTSSIFKVAFSTGPTRFLGESSTGSITQIKPKNNWRRHFSDQNRSQEGGQSEGKSSEMKRTHPLIRLTRFFGGAAVVLVPYWYFVEKQEQESDEKLRDELNVALLLLNAQYQKGGESEQIVLTYLKIGDLYEALGDRGKALEYYLMGLKMSRKVLGEWDSTTGLAAQCVGDNYKVLGQHERSLSHYLEALDISRKIFGEAYLGTGAMYHNVAMSYEALGQHENALTNLFKGLEIFRKELGEYDRLIAVCYLDISICFRRLGRQEEALKYGLKGAKSLLLSGGIKSQITR